MSDAYWKYMELMVQEARLRSDGLENTDRMDDLHEIMDDEWFSMTKAEKGRTTEFRDELLKLMEFKNADACDRPSSAEGVEQR